jgi:hypothetical protein
MWNRETDFTICSAHRTPVPDCPRCQVTSKMMMQDPEWAKKVKKAQEAGEYTCICGFTYYKIISMCPKCGASRPVWWNPFSWLGL